MHQRVLQHVNPPERRHVNPLVGQRVNQVEHQHVNRPEYQQINHLLYASKTHHQVQTVSPLEFLHLNDPNLVQTEHPVIVVVQVEAVPEEAVVIVGVVLEEEEEVEDANNRFIRVKFHAVDLKGKTEIRFHPL